MARVKSLTLKKFLQRSLLIAAIPIMVTGLSACSGSDGAAGPRGATGATGPAGPAGPVTTTAESCTVCHSAGAIEDIAVAHPDPTDKNLTVTVTSINADATGHAVVAFHVASGATGITGLSGSNLSLKLADLVPAGTGDNTFSTDYYEMWDSETPGTAAQLVDCAADTKYNTTTGVCDASPGTSATLAHAATTNLNDLGAGDYSYTFAYAFGQAWPGYNNAGYAPANHKRLAIELSKPATGYNKAVGIMDFDIADPAVSVAATPIATSLRQFGTINACRKCHGPLMDGAAHANNRNDLRECVFCHSALYGSLPRHAAGFMAADNADLPVFIHGIHGSTWTDLDTNEANDDEFPSGPGVTYPVTFPQPIQDCLVCHDAGEDTLGAGNALPGGDNWKTHPTMRVCKSCHTSIKFDGTSFVGLDGVTKSHNHNVDPTPNVPGSGCTACHAADGGPLPTAADPSSIMSAHYPTKATDYAPATDINAPEFDVTLSVTDPAVGTYYMPGDTFTVTATLKNHATGADVDPSIYTTAQDAAYVAGGGLHVASLYVYGPRSNAVPLLGTQALSLFGHGDATGFHYDVTVPADATSGTYMIRTRFADYSYDRNNPGPASHPYQLESFALTNIQIGTATVQKKIDGNADCKACHGETLMHENDHAAPFDTDHCTACHDRSGGHGDYIGNRVHAVHSANSTGDLSNYTNGLYVTPPSRDWSGITFPLGSINPADGSGSTQKCVICHVTGETSGTYKTNVYASPCIGCHGDNNANNAHIQQNGGQFTTSLY